MALTRKTKELYRVPKGQLALRRRGEQRWRLVGNMANFTISQSSTLTPYPTNEDSDATPAFQEVTDLTMEGAFEVRNWGPLIAELEYLGRPESVVQAAATDQSYVLDGPISLQDTIILGKRMVTNVEVTSPAPGGGGTAPVWLINTHYVLDSQAGWIVIIAFPAGYDGEDDITVNFDNAEYEREITTALTDGPLLDFEMQFRYTNANGPKEVLYIAQAQITTDGDHAKVQDTDLGTSQFKFTIYKDPTFGYYQAEVMPLQLAA